jgi:7 transmembrane sweet-taste receptor of 3 GCPR
MDHLRTRQLEQQDGFDDIVPAEAPSSPLAPSPFPSVSPSSLSPSLEPSLSPTVSSEPTTPPSFYPTTALDIHFDDARQAEAYKRLSISLATIASVVCFFAMIFVCVNRNKPIIRVGQPPFLMLICFGSLLLSVSLYSLAFDDSHMQDREHTQQLSASCVARTWIVALGLVLVYVSLFCKLLRVYKVTRAFRKNQVIKVLHVLWPLVLFLAAVIGILIAMTVEDAPKWYWVLYPLDDDDNSKSSDTDNNSQSYELGGICYGWFAYLVPLLVIFLIALILVFVMAWKTRSLNNEGLTDNRRIIQVLASHILANAFWLGVFIYVEISGNNYQFHHFAVIVAEFIIPMSSVGFLIGPKVYYVWHERRKGSLPENINFVGGRVKITGLSSGVDVERVPIEQQVGNIGESGDDYINSVGAGVRGNDDINGAVTISEHQDYT